jgi:hypothetical protein
MIEYGLEKTTIQHELGGGDSYRLTRDLYFASRPRLVVGDRPVPQDLWDQATRDLMVIDEKALNEKIAGLKGR